MGRTQLRTRRSPWRLLADLLNQSGCRPGSAAQPLGEFDKREWLVSARPQDLQMFENQSMTGAESGELGVVGDRSQDLHSRADGSDLADRRPRRRRARSRDLMATAPDRGGGEHRLCRYSVVCHRSCH